MDIRLHDLPDEVARFAAEFHRLFDIASDSGDYLDRGASRKVRRYLDIRIKTTNTEGTGDDYDR